MPFGLLPYYYLSLQSNYISQPLRHITTLLVTLFLRDCVLAIIYYLLYYMLSLMCLFIKIALRRNLSILN